MARRAGGALAATLVIAAAILPVLFAESAGAADASDAQSVSTPVSITITRMSPRWAGPGATITVSGSLTNTSQQPIGGLSVQLLGSSQPVSSVAELQQQSPGQLISLADAPLPGATWQRTADLAAKATADWSIRVKASVIGLTTFGVYPLAAQAQTSLTPIASDTTYLPYVPTKKGAYSYSRPTASQVAWVWPLVDTPLLNEPWRGNCYGAQASALAASVASGGRLAALLDAAAAAAGRHQNAASRDQVTWAIDPALLANIRALTTCASAKPQWARAATAWLAELRSATAKQPLFVTPYADPDVTALVGQGLEEDLTRAYELGWTTASQILHRDVSPVAKFSAEHAAAATAWPASGVASYSTLENLAADDNIGTLLLNSSVLSSPDTVLRTPAGNGSYANVVLASSALTQLLSSATSAPGSTFGTAQQFLAETAIMAQQNQPIVVAPPQRWQPSAGLAKDLLADTASAPWLHPVKLTGLTASATSSSVLLPATAGGGDSYSRRELDQLRALDRQVGRLTAIQSTPDPALYVPLFTFESSAWQGGNRAIATGKAASLAASLAGDPAQIKIIAESRVVLGGLKGSVSVSIENRLSYPVQVRLQLTVSQSSATKITESPHGLIIIPAHTAQPVRLHFQTTQTGSTTIAMQLLNRGFQPLTGQSVDMTVQATQVGVLGVIILAAALGVFLVASAARAVRRGRPPASRPGDGAGPMDDSGRLQQETEGGANEAGPDTVMAEHTEVGRAGAPGP